LSLQKKTLAAGRWQIVNVGTFAIMNIAYLMIMARLVDKEYHGIFAVLQIMVGILGMVSKSGLYVALVRREENTNEQISFSFWGSMILGAFFTILIFVLSDSSSGLWSMGLLRMYLLMLFLIISDGLIL